MTSLSYVVSANPTLPDEGSFFTSVLVIFSPICIVVLHTLCFISSSFSCLAANKVVGYKKSTRIIFGPTTGIKEEHTPGGFEATAEISDSYRISLGSLLRFNVSSSMKPTKIRFWGYLENADTLQVIKYVPAQKISRSIAYRKPVEEFQLWGTGYVNCRKGTWCRYSAIAEDFPEGLELKVYFCLTNYSPSEVTNKMMK